MNKEERLNAWKLFVAEQREQGSGDPCDECLYCEHYGPFGVDPVCYGRNEPCEKRRGPIL